MADKVDEEYLRLHLHDYRKENGYVFVFFSAGDLKEFLEEYMSSNSSCFVLSDRHSKESYLQEECEFNLCKICRDDDGEDWVGCDGCAQYFHANCLGVSYSKSSHSHSSFALIENHFYS